MQTGTRIGLAVGAVVIGCGIGVGAAYMLDLFPAAPGSTDTAASREGGPGGPFTLVDETGKTVTDADFRGKYMLAFFGYTFCPDVCPTTLADMASVMDALGDDAAAMQPVFISVDWKRDTPDALADYVAVFDDRIMGLSGTEAQIESVVDEYGVWYEFVEDETDPEFFLVNHTAGVYFMDKEGRFVRVFSYQTTTDEMVDSIRAIMQEDATS